MSQYSEMMGSFIRTGDYPMEANYIFNSEDELKAFYTNEINKTTLHKGLFRVVATNELQTLYWVVQVGEELQFKPLIQSDSIDKLLERITQLRNNLNKEVEDRKSEIEKFIGTDNVSDFQEGLDNLLAISNAVKQLQDSNIVSEIVGTKEENLLEYLKSLDYNNLTDISNLLHKFFDTIDESDSKLNTLPELQQFLEEFDYTKSLKQQLNELLDRVLSASNHRDDNLQTELNQTQVGVGLSQDGSFSPDQETNYLKNATSIMNALKTLDSLIAQALRTSKLIPIETNSVALTVDEDVTSSNISANVKIANGSDIIINNDGLYTKLSTDYNNGMLTIRINGNIRAQHYLAITSIVDDAYYNPEDETLVIKFKNSQEVIIPVEKLITEWIIENSDDSVIELNKTRVVDGPDILSADIKLSSKENNSLQKESDGLYSKQTESNLDFIDGALQYSINGKIVKTIPLADKLLVTPTLNVTWEATKQNGDFISLGSLTNSKSLSLERGYKVKGTFNFKWTHEDSKKDPNSTSGICGSILPVSEQLSSNTIIDNITTNRTFTQNLTAPKNGFMVSGSNVVLASGVDTTSSSASVNFTSKIYYGASTSSTPSITSLTNSKQQTSRSNTLTKITATSEQYWSYAYPKDLGALTKITQNGASPVIEDFNRTEQTVINDAGASIVYYIYTSKNRGAFTNVELKFE